MSNKAETIYTIPPLKRHFQKYRLVPYACPTRSATRAPCKRLNAFLIANYVHAAAPTRVLPAERCSNQKELDRFPTGRGMVGNEEACRYHPQSRRSRPQR